MDEKTLNRRIDQMNGLTILASLVTIPLGFCIIALNHADMAIGILFAAAPILVLIFSLSAMVGVTLLLGDD